MQKKILFSLVLFISIIAFSITFTFATDGKTGLEKAADSVRNVVGGAENGVENAARNISNTSKNVTGTMENEASNMTNNNNSMISNTNSNNYTAQRTSTTTDNSLFGMNSTTFIWLILAITAIAIIALVYYYTASISNRNTHNYNDE